MFGFAHQYFLHWFEKKLQKINPKFSFFYWDVGREFDEWGKSKIWKYMGSDTGKVTGSPIKDIVFKSMNESLTRSCDFIDTPPPSEYYSQIWTDTEAEGYSKYWN